MEYKFRQAIFTARGEFSVWHYWGFINTEFIGPLTGRCSMANVQKDSYQFIGRTDASRIKIYEGDIVQSPRYGTGIVTYDEGAFILKDRNNDTYCNWPTEYFDDCKVISNIVQCKFINGKVRHEPT